MRRPKLALAACSALLLSVAAGVAFGGGAPAAPSATSAESHNFSFSVTSNSPLISTGVHPADVLGAGLVILIPCANLGLVCDDLVAGTKDDLAAMSYGFDFVPDGSPAAQFAVGPGALGRPASAVRVEANCSPAEPQADVFEGNLAGANAQDLDGDGAACGANNGLILSLNESPSSDAVDALERDPCTNVDLNCDGLPETSVYFALMAGSPSLGLYSATGRDILMTSNGSAPAVWAAGAALGLSAGDQIDGLCLLENGDLQFGARDRVLISLAPGSPSLGVLGANAADLIRPAPLRVAYSAASLGLLNADNLTDEVCNFGLLNVLFLPSTRRDSAAGW